MLVKSDGVGGKRSVKEKMSPDFPHKFSAAGVGERGRGEGGGAKPRPSAESKAVYEAYGPIENGSRKEPSLVPVV